MRSESDEIVLVNVSKENEYEAINASDDSHPHDKDHPTLVTSIEVKDKQEEKIKSADSDLVTTQEVEPEKVGLVGAFDKNVIHEEIGKKHDEDHLNSEEDKIELSDSGSVSLSIKEQIYEPVVVQNETHEDKKEKNELSHKIQNYAENAKNYIKDHPKTSFLVPTVAFAAAFIIRRVFKRK